MSLDLEESPVTPTSGTRREGRRLFLSLADQGVVSLVTFLTGMLAAKAAGSAMSEVALYYLALTLFIAIGEVGNSIVSTPHMLQSPRLSGRRLLSFNGSMLQIQAIVSLVLVLLILMAAGIAWLVGSEQNAWMLLLTGLCAIPISLRNFARNLLFARREAGGALTLDVCVCAIQLGVVLLLFFSGRLEWWNALLAVGLANLIGTVGFFLVTRDLFSFSHLRAVADAKRNWGTSKWLLASSLTWTAGIYLYPWVVYMIAGGDQTGIWGVCWQLAAVGNPLVMAVQNYLGPQIAHAHVELSLAAFRGYVLKMTGLFTVAVLPVAIVMAIASEWLLVKLFHADYAGNGSVAAVLVFSLVFFAISFGMSRGLFSLGFARVDLHANLAPLVTLVGLGIVLTQRFGALGAAVALLIGMGFGCFYRTVAFLRESSRAQASTREELQA